ncbi:MAG: sensor histidine kinase [Chitinophagaceae bacterium]|nr:sensor histidine kinase [Chitinophagaceae bacterium]
MKKSSAIYLLLIFLPLIAVAQGNVAHTELESTLKKMRVLYSSHSDSLQACIQTAMGQAIEQKNYSAQVEIYRTKGANQYLSGDLKSALDTYIEGIKIGEAHNVKKELVTLYYEIAGVFSKSSSNNIPLASSYIRKGLGLAAKYKDNSCLADGGNRIGLMLDRQGKPDSALLYFNNSYRLYSTVPDSIGMSYSLENQASIYSQQKKYKLAIQKLKESLQIRTRKNDQYGIAMANINLSEVYKEANELDSAVLYAHRAEVSGKAINFIDLVQYTYDHMTNLYKSKKRYDVALSYHEKYIALKDSIFNANSTKQINELSAKFQTERKEQEIKVLNKSKTIQRLGLIASLLALSVMIIVAFAIYKNRKAKELQLKAEGELQLQLKEAEAKNAMQHERLRISRELHDNIGAHLTFINATVQSMDHNNEKAQQVQDLTNETIRELRKTVWLINKSSVKVEEFVLKLREFLKNIPQVKVTAQLANSAHEMHAEMITELFRAIQESVNNAVKYAQAQQINVSIIADAQAIQITVSDDGVGFDMAAQKDSGFGLENMQHRLQAIGGTCHINSQIDKGTTVLLNVGWAANTINVV